MVAKIRNVRKANEIIIPEGNKHIPDSFRSTLNNEKFLFFEHLEVKYQKILLFTTFSNLVHLSHTKVWVCDGTFYSCPEEYFHLYTIQDASDKNFIL
jgi:hypothetical protein